MLSEFDIMLVQANCLPLLPGVAVLGYLPPTAGGVGDQCGVAGSRLDRSLELLVGAVPSNSEVVLDLSKGLACIARDNGIRRGIRRPKRENHGITWQLKFHGAADHLGSLLGRKYENSRQAG